MCGIAGVLSPALLDKAAVLRMTDRITHRGPDDAGVWVDSEAGIGLGSRRLAIIDLSSAGHQPMQSSNGKYVITFNGEIYNHKEIRAALDEAGNTPESGWRGHSDTETFLEAIAAWGLERALESSVGMFAFGLWNRESRTLRLVRDRFGEKPLYYGWAGKDFLFGSELKALRSHPNFSGEINRRAVGLFAARAYIPAPLSIYLSAFKLEPACILTVQPGAPPRKEPLSVGQTDAGLSIKRYWSYRHVLGTGLADPIESEGEAVDELERLVGNAVKSQSLADVTVGAFLSGGVDSSAVVGLYQKYSSQKVRTFTIGFDETAFNEADHARRVAAHFGTEHHERVVTANEARDVISMLPQIYDEPFADSSQIPTYLVSKFAREQVKVALSGDAGDELFGGYNRYFATGRVWRLLKHLPGGLRSIIATPLGALPSSAWDLLGKLAGGGSSPPYFGIKARKSLRTIAHARNLDDVFKTFLDEWSDVGSPVQNYRPNETAAFDLEVSKQAPDALRMMYCDAVSYLPDDILCKVDRASMAVGLEVHCPFLDHRIAEFAARIPIGMNIRGGTGKHVLRGVLYREAPRELFERPKAGFGVPVGEWIKGPLREWAEDLLDDRTLQIEGWLDARIVRKRWEQHLSGQRESGQAIWSILMFQAWNREHSKV